MQQTWRGLQSALRTALYCAVVGGMCCPIFAITGTRAEENQETSPISERHESSSSSCRIDRERQHKHEQRNLAFAFVLALSSRLGHTQNAVLWAPSGHRLSNGLLAPITC
jgi:hypothetical protein